MIMMPHASTGSAVTILSNEHELVLQNWLHGVFSPDALTAHWKMIE